MKKKCKVPLVRLAGIIGIIAIAAVIGLTIIACEEEKDDGDDGGKGSVKTFTSIADFKKWLDAQPENTEETAYNVKVNISDLKGESGDSGSLGHVIFWSGMYGKYVNLDLSGSTFTTIGKLAFHTCDHLTSVTIPNSVTSIGDSAFFNCVNLTSVTIPNSVTSISKGTFEWCESLTNVTIPNSVTSIGESAFDRCKSLVSVRFERADTTFSSNPYYDSLYDSFPGASSLQTVYTAGGIGTYTRPNGGLTWTKQ